MGLEETLVSQNPADLRLVTSIPKGHFMSQNQVRLPVAGISKFLDRESGELRTSYIDNIGVAFITTADGVALGATDIRRIEVILDALPLPQKQHDGMMRAVLSIAPPPRPPYPAEARPAPFGRPANNRRPNPRTDANQLDPELHYAEPPLAGRCVCLDTEATGFHTDDGDRIVDIALVELVDGVPTGREFASRINPQRMIPGESSRIHGIIDTDVADAPIFAAVADQVLAFIGDDTVVTHNAEFDLAFVNAELQAAGRPIVDPGRAYCTLRRARYLHPEKPNSLDRLCQRYGIDTSARIKHGALIDARLLAQVLPHLKDGPRPSRDGWSVAVNQ